jgi:hypothetical protein
LILPTHIACNESHSVVDELIAQLVSVLHGHYPKPKNVRLKIKLAQGPGLEPPGVVLTGVNLKGLVWRWVRGFHAALYREYLPGAISGNIEMPLPTGRQLPLGAIIDPIFPQTGVFVQELKKNRMARTVDRVEAFGGKCVYECVWATTDDGRWICIFGLRIYDWENLADTRFQKRGCVGYYMPSAEPPLNASRSTRLIVPSLIDDGLDPFQ